MVSLLLDCHELAARLATHEPPVVLDVRWTLGGPSGDGDFRSGHIPGAHFVDLDRELSAPPGLGRHPLPDAASFAAAMRRHGVDHARRVVVYDAATGTSAARAWWLLRYFGHSNVALLDGGFAAWTAADLPVEEGADSDPIALRSSHSIAAVCGIAIACDGSGGMSLRLGMAGPLPPPCYRL